MRRPLLLLAALLLLLTIVAAALRPEPASAGRIPLLWASSANPYRAAQVARFNALHPSLHLAQDSSNNRFEKNIVQLSSGVGPDLYDAISGAALQAYVESGVALDLTALAAAQGLSAATDTWPAMRHEIVLEGRQYGYPANVTAQVVLYNQNVFDRFGVPYPDAPLTWDEFFALLRRVSGAPPGAHGTSHVDGLAAMDYSGRAPAVVVWKLVFHSRRGEFFSADGTRPTLATEDLRLAFELHQAAIFQHRIHPPRSAMAAMTGAGAWGGGAIAQFAEGRFAALVSGKFALASLREFIAHQKSQLARWEADPERQRRQPRPEVLRLGALELPRFADRPPGCLATAQTVAINPASPHRDEALAFLRFLGSEDYARLVMPYGLPGNPRQVIYDFPVTHAELAEHEVTRRVVASLEHGYQTRKSPFLLDLDVERVLADQVARLEADPSLDVAQLLAEAQTELDRLLQLNLRRDPRLAQLHRERLAAAGQSP